VKVVRTVGLETHCDSCCCGLPGSVAG